MTLRYHEILNELVKFLWWVSPGRAGVVYVVSAMERVQVGCR